MTRHLNRRTAALGRRLTALVLSGALTILIGGCTVEHNAGKSPDKLPETIDGMTDAQQIKLIDSMRAKGSYDDAKTRLVVAAHDIGERITAAVPGQTWKYTDNPGLQEDDQNGSTCKLLTDDVAARPRITVDFGSTFSAEGFKAAADVVRQEAAKFGATNASSLFGESAKRDYDVSGNGYQFSLGQINFAMLLIRGDCFLLQKTLDLPPGQLPPLPPILPTTQTPSR
jgi:hypothetical protein